MEQAKPIIVFSDRLDNGLLIGFEDGKTAFFPAALLYAALPQARMIQPDPKDRAPHKKK